jgi:formamidopyrimidine-DNA glycosylase
MPELPEVETVKRELGKTVSGKKISAVIIKRPEVIKEPAPAKFVKELTGKSIKKILRKGKLLILKLSSGRSLTVHLKMTGQLVYPGDVKKSRVSFKLSDGKLLDFNDSRLLGELRVVNDWRALKFVKALGPEPFDLNLRQFKEMLKKRKTKIKSLLMDQAFISGVGNLYAAEALFKAKIHPHRVASCLSLREAERLLKEIKQTLKQAIRCRGSSVDQYVQLTGQPGDYVRYHRVYDRKDKPCFVCKTPIKRIVTGGRGTYFCPKCQK